MLPGDAFPYNAHRPLELVQSSSGHSAPGGPDWLSQRPRVTGEVPPCRA
jgi:hypothetical protein